jgi:acyl-CoA thioesterase I
MLRRLLIVLVLLLPAGAYAGTILVVGDSLSAAYGMATEAGWVAQLQKRLQAQGFDYTVVNASISGDTTAGGRTRLPKALAQHRPDIVIIELGGNDGLRGLPVDQMKRNLAAMIEAAKRANARVVLVGVMLPPNYGPAYNERFTRVYAELAKEQRVPLVPVLIDGLSVDDFQADGIHPTSTAQSRMLENVWPVLKSVL